MEPNKKPSPAPSSTSIPTHTPATPAPIASTSAAPSSTPAAPSTSTPATSTSGLAYSSVLPATTPAPVSTSTTTRVPTYVPGTGSAAPLSPATIQALLSQAVAAQAVTSALPKTKSYYNNPNSSSNATTASTSTQAFDPNSAVWKNSSWAATLAAYPYTAQQQLGVQYPQQYGGYSHYQPGYQNQYKAGTSTGAGTSKVEQPKVAPKPRTPSPPPPEPPRDWDVLLKKFFKRMGLTQALQGLEMDMLVMNEDWEAKRIASALDDLVKGIQTLRDKSTEEQKDVVVPEKPLEERKLGSVHLANGEKPSSPTSINKSISQFLARKRANNDMSNRNEFLLSLPQKRAKLDLDQGAQVSSCARTDAKHIDRESQMKYDIAKNEDGPLRRTMRRESRAEEGEADSQPSLSPSTSKGKGKGQGHNRKSSVPGSVSTEPMQIDGVDRIPTPDRHPALDERLSNIESHFADGALVPSPPLNLLDRLKFLEDHIIQLEKDFPPWAALHFNQPNREWPPPPQATPIIVPNHLTRDLSKKGVDDKTSTTPTETLPKSFRKDSSLHRALLEKLEVATDSSPWATIPPEILSMILRKVKKKKKEIFHCTGHDFLLPSTVVSKHWGASAITELYYEVGVNEYHKAHRLRKTLEARPDLAECVRIVRLGLGGYSGAETKAHAAIIRACPNLETIYLSGWNGGALPKLLDAIREKKTLKKIQVHRHTMKDTECDVFCSSMEFLRMMVGWPLLEEVYCHNRALGWEEHDEDETISDVEERYAHYEVEARQEDEDYIAEASNEEEKAKRIESVKRKKEALAEWDKGILDRTRRVKKAKAEFDIPSAHVNKNPRLRFLRWNSMSSFVDDYMLGKLALMAPNLQHFCVTWGYRSKEQIQALINALRVWKGTLRELHLDDADGDKKMKLEVTLDKVLPELRSLQILWISDVFVKGRTVGELVAPLEYLKYEGRQSELDALAKALGKTGSPALPTLTVLRTSSVPFGDEPGGRLKTVCGQRGILLNPWQRQEVGDDYVDGFRDPNYDPSYISDYYGDEDEDDG
ncbi:hypothetical protein VNI00_003895 [Paramarasmius palmivorus]|uniref:F-box domain-containing protein n=1 Tax=Paramarasmius palmivorus TaxID=297713 RepID=A0AAW0DN91_9AGAR